MSSGNLAFVSYETRFAPSGGIAAVMRHLPQAMKSLSGQRTIVITPWHRLAMETMPAVDRIGLVSVTSGDDLIDVGIQRHTTPDGFEWFFLTPEDETKQIFHGVADPYRTSSAESLVRDSLFFGSAVIQALPLIAAGDWTLFLQDWEAATAALAAASMGARARCILTLHNSYDSGSISPGKLREAGIDSAACPGFQGLGEASILERALPLVERRVFTVSAQFGSDLCEDVLQTRVMAPHLGHALRDRIVGVDNGPFESTIAAKITAARHDDKTLALLTAKASAISRAKSGDHDAFIAWKNTRRNAFIDVLETFQFTQPDFPLTEDRKQHKPFWGNRQRFIERAKTDIPWFITGGRDDSRQRGHDVAVAAAERFLDLGQDALFIFMVLPGQEDFEGLRFLHDLTQRSDGRVIALPFRFAEGFLAALEGASFGIFPSLYEPFGGANEFYLQGTVGIARATGGLIEQIVPFRAARCHSHAVHRRASVWHGFSARPTGLLYREMDEEGTVESWTAINEARYDALGEGGLNRIEQRQQIPVFVGMARELCSAMMDAVDIFRQSSVYTEMVLDGMAYIERTFSWKRAAAEYQRVLTPP